MARILYTPGRSPAHDGYMVEGPGHTSCIPNMLSEEMDCVGGSVPKVSKRQKAQPPISSLNAKPKLSKKE